MVGGCAGGSIAVGVHADPVDMMPGVVGELGQECPTGASVALPERGQAVSVVGMSLGGLTPIRLAATQPELVHRAPSWM